MNSRIIYVTDIAIVSMYPWIWIQSLLRKLWLPGYTVLIPLRWKLDLAWQRALGSLRHNSGSGRFTG